MNNLKTLINERKILILETLPPKGLIVDDYIDFCKNAVNKGVDGISIVDMPVGKIRCSPISVAKILLENDITPIVHFTRTTRSAPRIEGDLIAFNMLGIKNLLIITGDDPKNGDYNFATKVEDFTIYQIFELLRKLENNTDFVGNKIPGKFEYFAAAALNQNNKNINLEIDKIKRKIEAGADYFITQPILDIDVFVNFLDALEKNNLKIKLVASFLPFKNYKQIDSFSKIPGINFPEKYLKLENYDSDYIKKYTLDLVYEIIDKTYNRVNGFHIVGLVKEIEVIDAISKYIFSSSR